ncbi:MAG: hypothetical protein ACM3N4_02885 [Nitrososphaerota archaeon]
MAGEQHPTDWKDIDPEWREDLNPHAADIQGQGIAEPEAGKFGLTAEAIKALQQGALRELTDEQLREIPVLPVGSRLRQGATYLDLNDPQRRPFTAMGGMVAGEDNYYVPKDNIDYTLWNRLIGVTKPERLDIGEE